VDAPQHIDEKLELRSYLKTNHQGNVNKFIRAQSTIGELPDLRNDQCRPNAARGTIGILQ
jgi:hypothetical protein